MAATRRYAIAQYDRFGIAKLLYTSSTFSLLILIVLAAVLGLYIYSFHGPMPKDALRLFEFIPSAMIHDVGVIAGIINALVALLGMVNMIIHISKDKKFPKDTRLNWLESMWKTIGVE